MYKQKEKNPKLIRHWGRPSLKEVSIANDEIANNPYSRLMYNTIIGEKLYLPLITAYSREEIVYYTKCIDEAFGLSYAKEKGLVRDWTVIWTQNYPENEKWQNVTPYPKRPIKVRLFPPYTTGSQFGWRNLISRAFLNQLYKMRKTRF